jgi:ribosome-associated protein
MPPIIMAPMSRRPAPGRTPAREPDAAFDEEGRPSKSQLKRESHDLQALGEAVAALPDARLADAPMPDALRDAVAEYRRTRSHEGRRRQMQLIGKLMRSADAEPLREAVASARLGTAKDALRLHEAERWRTALLADDEALTRWAGEHPGSDIQRLRSLLRAASTEVRPEAGAGQSTRQTRSYRELFQFINQQLAS